MSSSSARVKAMIAEGDRLLAVHDAAPLSNGPAATGAFPSDDDLILLGYRALILEHAASMVYSDPEKAMALIPGVDILNGTLSMLRNAVFMSSAVEMANRGRMERDIRADFFKRLDELLPGARQAILKIAPQSQPDGFVHWRGELCCVEVKRKVFDKHSLAQLKGYLDFYGHRLGIAVAPELKVELPDYIHFVQLV